MPSSTKAMPSATKAPRQRVIKKSPCKVTTPIPNVGSYRLRERRKGLIILEYLENRHFIMFKLLF